MLEGSVQAARHRVNRLIDEMGTMLLAEFDAEARFVLRAERRRGRGQHVRAIALLHKAQWR